MREYDDYYKWLLKEIRKEQNREEYTFVRQIKPTGTIGLRDKRYKAANFQRTHNRLAKC